MNNKTKSVTCGSAVRGTLKRITTIAATMALASSGHVLSAQSVQTARDPASATTIANGVKTAIANVNSGMFSDKDVDLIAIASKDQKAEGIQSLKAQFANSHDALDRDHIASSLVWLGESDDIYWNYLLSQAIPAIEDDAPFVLAIDQGGKVTKRVSPEFVRWATAHQLPPDEAARQELFTYPSVIINLGASRDARAVPLLREALYSKNFYVQAEAARGLANIGDKASVPLIVEACSRVPAEAAAQIALPLVYFDDESAQKAVAQYVPKELSAESRNNRSNGITPFGSSATREVVGPPR
jgi:HEAT repeat protein